MKKIQAIIALFVLSDGIQAEAPSKPTKADYYWRVYLDFPAQELKSTKKSNDSFSRYGIGGAFGLTIPIGGATSSATGCLVEPMLGVCYLGSSDEDKKIAQTLIPEIRISPMVDVGYGIILIVPFVGVQGNIHILAGEKPLTHQENMFDISARFGLKAFKVFKFAATYTFLSNGSAQGNWGGIISIGWAF